MNVVHSGGKYQIFGDELKTYDSLPVGTYEIQFSNMSGFFLTQHNDLNVNEEKIYGTHERRVKKILRSFENANRNLGVILSGRKGTGKTLFARVLSNAGAKVNLPTLLVKSYTPGIANFISSIEQEVIVLFDEFEKTFTLGGMDRTPQEELLPLFDGIDDGKKLYIVTCNEMNKVSTYLLNRPGRFHYHFVVGAPTDEEVVEYMTDKLDAQYHHYIDRIVKFAMCGDGITYDILRAIAFELNQGFDLAETLDDLNIQKAGAPWYECTIVYKNGDVSTRRNDIDFMSMHGTIRLCFNIEDTDESDVYVQFNTSDVVANYKTGEITVAGDKVKVEFCIDEDDEKDNATAVERAKNREVDMLYFKKLDRRAVDKYCI